MIVACLRCCVSTGAKKDIASFLAGNLKYDGCFVFVPLLLALLIVEQN